MVDTTSVDSDPRLSTLTEALKKAEGRLIAGQHALEVMHEIRGPLEALGNFLYLACNEGALPPAVQKHLAAAEEQRATLYQIASRTLGFAKSTLKPLPTELALLTESALRIHQRAIEAKNIHLVKDLAAGLIVDVHSGEILQVISNLIINALDSLPADGVLSVRLHKGNGEVHFIIADNGHGIPQENLEAIFQPFFTTKQERGTGLGLALSKSIIERHRGRIRLRSSTRPGKSGTYFRISLPA